MAYYITILAIGLTVFVAAEYIWPENKEKK